VPHHGAQVALPRQPAVASPVEPGAGPIGHSQAGVWPRLIAGRGIRLRRS
jgi:hypothetical protein